MLSSCEKSGRLYPTVVCMGEWIIRGDDTGFGGEETGFDFEGV
jgi:hypothetical protein